MPRDIAHWIDHWAAVTPDKTAIRFDGHDISYTALADCIAQLAAALTDELDIKAGDRVGYLGYNRPEQLILLFACARIGAIQVPLNWRLAPAEHLYILDNAGVSAVVAEAEFTAHLDTIRRDLGQPRCVVIGQAADTWLSYDVLVDRPTLNRNDKEIDSQSPVLIVYTSGTTGKPKGAVLTQNALSWNALNAVAAQEMSSRDHVLNTLPMFHVGGLNIQTLPALYAGATVTLHSRFDPASTLKEINESRPTLTLMVPAIMKACLDHPDWPDTDISCLRMMSAGSSIIPDALLRGFHDRGVPVVQIYGSTETAPVAVTLPPGDAMRKMGSAGKPVIHCAIRIVDDAGDDVPTGEPGELLVRGPNLMREYWNNPAATADALRDGWYYSGDVGHIDDEGFIYIDERKSDLIISGGENIYPAELENVLADCPDLVESAVVGRSDSKWGQVPVAVVVAKDQDTTSRDSVLSVFQDRLARFKHPHDVIFVNQLPRNAMGKVLRYKLRSMVKDTG